MDKTYVNFSRPRFFITHAGLLFLALGIVLSTIFYLYATSQYQNAITQQKVTQESLNTAKKLALENTLADVGRDALYLADFISIHELINKEKYELINAAKLNLLAYSFRQGLYDQIRFLDMGGNEIVRINYNDGIPQIVPSEDLQNKAHRYYFKDSIILEKDQVYVSTLDLNIEHGEIEIPHKPVIRIATPVFTSDGEKTGVAVLNYLANNLLEQIYAFNLDQRYSYIMTNKNKEFLFYDKQPDLAFNFMTDPGNPEILNDVLTDFADNVYSVTSGILESDTGLLAFNTVFPLAENWVSSTGSSTADGDSGHLITSDDYFWKIISYLPNDTLQQIRTGIFMELRNIFFIILLLLLIFSISITLLQLQKKINKMEISYLAHNDMLTGLANRPHIMQLIDHQLELEPNASSFALLYMDLDKFKPVNDTLGHAAGDFVLREIGKRLSNCPGKSTIPARIGGDEFLVMITDTDSVQEIESIANIMIETICRPIQYSSSVVELGVSIGISIYPKDGASRETLIHCADESMYSAKKAGGNRFVISMHTENDSNTRA